jgi:hypothetical protein
MAALPHVLGERQNSKQEVGELFWQFIPVSVNLEEHTDMSLF